MRTTIGTSAPQRYRILRGVVDQLIEAGGDEVVELDLADRPLPGQRRADADAEHGALSERRVDDAIAELLQQRPQQQKRVAVLAADVLAVHEHARIGASASPIAEHDGIEERPALRIERRAGLERRQRGPVGVERASRTAGSSTSTCARGSSFANTPTPAVRGSGHGASITARACSSTIASASRLNRSSSPASMMPSPSSRAAYVAIGSRAAQYSYSSRSAYPCSVSARILPRRLRIAAEVQHVVVMGVAAHPHRHQLDQRRTRARARPLGGPRECRGDLDRDRCRRA